MKKTKVANPIDMVNDYINCGREKNVLHLRTEDNTYDGRIIQMNEGKFLNFGNCSYLGLEIDSRLKDSAKDYIDRYGVQFSSSRTYLSCAAYGEYEELLEEMFDAPVVTFTSTTLGHHAVLPVVVEPGDAIIMDQQVHASIQDPAKRMILNGVHVEPLRHNRIDLLEERIKKLNNQHERIWYMIDGVYSMYGDLAPVQELVQLMEKYPKFWVYADDAHGMSIAGKHGAGMIYSQIKLPKKMIMATSLNKAFAAGGGIFIFPDREMATKVKNCSGAYLFSGGHQIAVLGAGIASAKIHLSDEIYQRQQELKEKLVYCHNLLEEHHLPVLSEATAPINYIGVGLVNTTIEMVSKLYNDGLYVNSGMFPAVPDQSAGLRFTITLHHKKEDIDRLVERVAYHYPRTFQEMGRSKQDIIRGFRKIKEFNQLIEGLPGDIIKSEGLEIQHETTIKNIPQDTWDKTIGQIGANNWEQLLFFEETFTNNPEKENNWGFHYFIIRDENGKVILSTFFTESITKDDMFAPDEVSKELENTRKLNNDPYYLSSENLTMGCLLSIGNHLYYDKKNTNWEKALNVLIDFIQDYREKKDIPVLSLRDFDADDELMKKIFIDMGMKRVNIPDGHVIDNMQWETGQDFLEQISGSNAKSTRDRKSYFKKRVLEFEDRFEVRTVDHFSPEKAKEIRQLYLNVSADNYEIAGYHLPVRFFENVIKHPNWEVLELYLKPEYNPEHYDKPVAMALSYVSDNWYSFLVTGMDYNFLHENIYPQILWQVIKKGKAKNLPVNMGITASQPKRKFGARVIKNVVYAQNKDTFKDTFVSLLPNQKSVIA